ncbi:MAG TPA: methylhydantoinase, partial [Gammaproteobacteria bacterium]|nr:methylhydantoinase [Gammaproteobacteria bacterium]
MSHRVGIDIGGTFTDFALLDVSSGHIATHKRLTTPAAPASGVLEGLSDLLVEEQVPVEQVEAVIHGTTLITNAIIERKGARIGMITTAGFSDVLEMANEHRYEMFDLRITYPAPLVERSCRVEVNGRIRYDGHVETALALSEVKLAVRHLVEEKEIESLAVCFLHSYANPDHERAVRDIVRADYPELFVSISCEVFPDIREFSRWTTTCINAYTQPLLDRYLRDLEQGLFARQVRAPLFIMTSSGGTTTPAVARSFPVRIMESGPAAGVLMSARHGEMLSIKNLLSFDMGGTTAKGALIIDGAVNKRYEIEVGRVHDFKPGSGLVAKIPAIDMIEIGYGGGSMSAIDARGLLAVGPDSAGAQPGPACYQQGGKRATLTDANLVLGYLDRASFLGGNFDLSLPHAEAAIVEGVSEKLDLPLARSAWGIHDVVNEGIARAFRIHASERGVDYRNSAIVAFGGSGPIHAIAVARKLRAPQVIFPVGAGVMSAFGLLASPLTFEVLQGKQVFLDRLTLEAFVEAFDRLMAESSQALVGAGVASRDIKYRLRLDMRYAGQGHAIEVALPEQRSLVEIFPTIEERFAERYAGLYAPVDLDAPVEITTW